MFFDILLAGCKGINKESYLNGSFKSNHCVPSNQKEILRQARLTLWNNLQNSSFHIKNITVSQNAKHIYMDNEIFEHRKNIFYEFEHFKNVNYSFQEFDVKEDGELLLNSLKTSSKLSLNKIESSSVMIINSILENSDLSFERNGLILNSQLIRCKMNIGENCYISDVLWVSLIFNIPEPSVLKDILFSFMYSTNI